MDRYNAVEYLFDCRAERPSLEETVFWREIGTWDEEEDVDARERCGIIATDILLLTLEVDFAMRAGFRDVAQRRLVGVVALA